MEAISLFQRVQKVPLDHLGVTHINEFTRAELFQNSSRGVTTEKLMRVMFLAECPSVIQEKNLSFF